MMAKLKKDAHIKGNGLTTWAGGGGQWKFPFLHSLQTVIFLSGCPSPSPLLGCRPLLFQKTMLHSLLCDPMLC